MHRPTPQPFDVLAPDLDLDASYLIEASAGTGKTFAIEHLIVRYLLKEPKVALDEITVVTFTKKAARQMRQRVRKNIEAALSGLLDPQNSQKTALLTPYLRAHLAAGASAVARAITFLQDALENFDQAKITTIHSFCARLLSQDALGGELINESQSQQETQNICERIVREWIFSHWCLGPFDQSSLQEAVRLLSEKPISWREKTLVTELVTHARSSIPLRPAPGLTALLRQMSPLAQSEDFTALTRALDLSPSPFCHFNEGKKRLITTAMELLKEPFSPSSGADESLLALLTLFKSCCSKNLKKGAPHHLISATGAVDRLAADFGDQLKKLESATNVFLRLGRACQIALGPQLMGLGARNFDQVLQRVAQRARNESFANSVKRTTKVFIVDEFQDTDPLQWEIFERLFLRAKGAIRAIFVGDPKQSIYAFRQADIYTYEKARAFVDQVGTLTTNYRARPCLIEGLNRLFSPERVGHWIELPKSGSYLALPKARFPQSELPTKRLHFLPQVETFEDLCEMTADLIVDLLAKKAVKPIAVLIDTHRRSQILQRVLARRHLSVHAQLNRPAAQLPAMMWLKSLLLMVLEPKDRTLRRALLEPLIGLTTGQVSEIFEIKKRGDTLNNSQGLARYVEILALRKHLRAIFLDGGFATFHSHLMISCWRGNRQSIAESMIQERTAAERAEWDGVVQLVIDLEQNQRLYPHELLCALDRGSEGEEMRLQLSPSGESIDVHILTLHACKGLEFSHVFALGAALTSQTRSRILEWVQIFDEDNRLATVEQTLLSSDQRAMRRQEHEAEKARLLYVALTRAKEQLFIPLPLPPSPRRGIAPIEWLLARFDVSDREHSALRERIQRGDFAPFFTWLCQQSEDPTSPIALMTRPNLQSRDNSSAKKEIAPILQRPVIVHRPPLFSYERTSFSAWQLNQRSDRERLKFHLSEQLTDDKSDDLFDQLQTISPRPPSLDEKNAAPWHRLPRGAITGQVLHALMEQIIVDRSLLAPAHHQRLARLIDFPKSIVEQFSWQEMLKEVLQAPIAVEGATLCLEDVAPARCRPEMEFLFPEERVVQTPAPYRGIYWNGYIDLFFEHSERYYLLDWKSNFLGAGDEYYTDRHIAEQIERCGYLDQAALYSEALRRFLTLSGVQRAFGGFIFFFLRGRKAHFLSPQALENRPRLLRSTQTTHSNSRSGP